MPVASENPVTDYALGGGTSLGPFSTGWTYEFGDEVHCTLIDAAEAETVLTAAVDFTLAGMLPLDDGGLVSLNADLLSGTWPTGHVLRIERRTSIEQAVRLQDQESVQLAVLTGIIDRIYRIMQEIRANGVTGAPLPGGPSYADTPLLAVNNLSDVPNKSAARANLGVGTGTGDMLGSNNLSELTSIAAAVANLGGPFGDMLKADNLAGLTDLNAALANINAASRTLGNVTLASLRDKAFRISGGGTRDRTLGTILADTANVNNYLNTGETDFSAAIARCLAANDWCYFPGGTNALGGDYYNTTSSITLANGQTLEGDGAATSAIMLAGGNGPVVVLGAQLYNAGIRGLTLSVAIPASGDHGVSQGTGATAWVNNFFAEDVLCVGVDIGWNLGKCFYGVLFNPQATSTLSEGFRLTTDGNTTVPSGSAGGPLQWVMVAPAFGSTGHDGIAYHVTGTAFGGSGVGSSVGTLFDVAGYAAHHHSIAYYGSAAHPLNGVRISGGLVGECTGSNIYLDAYSRDHVITLENTELAGGYNVRITANNANVVLNLSQCGGAFYDGVMSECDNLIVGPGNYVNNGRAGTGVENFAGIYILDGSATISGVTSQNFNSTIQQYGIRTNVDTLVINGCRLPGTGETGFGGATVNGALLSAANMGNVIGSIGGVALVNSVVSGCWPAAINVYGDATFNNLTVLGDTTTATLHSAATNFTGPVTLNSGVQISPAAGATATGLTVHNIKANVSVGIGQNASGTAGQLDVAGPFHANAASAFYGAITLAANGVQVSPGAGITGTGITVANIKAETSVGVGANPSGVAGQLLVNSAIVVGAATGGYVANGVNVAGDFRTNNTVLAAFGGTYTGNVTITGTLGVSGLTTVDSLSVTNAASMNGGLTMNGTTGITGTNCGLTFKDAAFSRSLGVGTTASGVSGRIDAGSIVGVTFGSLSVSGALSAGSLTVSGSTGLGAVTAGGVTLSGALAMGGNNISGVGAYGGSGDINVTGSHTIYITGGAFTNVDVSGSLEKSGSPYTFP